MKGRIKLQKTLLAVAFLMAVLILPAVRSEAAAAKPKCAKNVTCYLVALSNEANCSEYSIEACSNLIYIKNLASNAVIYNIKSSNKNVQVVKSEKMSALSIAEPARPGTKAKVSFKVKQNGKVYSLSCNVTFAKSPARFKSFKIGSLNLTSSANKSDFIMTKGLSGTQKFEIKPASGIAVDNIEICYDNGSSKNIKNGTSVSLNNAISINVYYKHTKKPKYYSAKGFQGMVPSPLHGLISIIPV